MELEKIITDLKEQGLDEEQILIALQKMVEEGTLAEEDLEKAKKLLLEQEKEEASKLFGLELI